jgi:hypothetical protein
MVLVMGSGITMNIMRTKAHLILAKREAAFIFPAIVFGKAKRIQQNLQSTHADIAQVTFFSEKMAKLQLIPILLILAGCASPSQHFTATALAYGFTESTVTGSPFEHRIYANS